MTLIEIITEYGPIVVTAASAVAASTPTPAKGSALWWGYRLIDFLALNIGRAKETGDDHAGS